MTDELKNHGFIRVHCDKCTKDDVYLKCESCAKSTNFLLNDDGVACHCGAAYSHAICTCGERVDREGLTFVSFEEGPMSLSDLEVSWPRVGALVAGVAAIVFGIWYFVAF